MLCNSGDDPERENRYLNVLLEKRVDGIILSPTGQNIDTIERIIATGIPLCFIDRIIDDIPCDYVVVDNAEATKNAVIELFERGYEKIAFLAPPQSIMTGKERLSGFRQAFLETGREINENMITYSEITLEGGRKAATEILQTEKPDVFFASNELIATGAFEAIQENGLKVPDDIGFLMWDDPEWTRIARPKVSVVSQPLWALGETAADLLFKRLNNLKGEERTEPVQMILKTTFTDRGSLKKTNFP
ncbi:MAG: substrate-binding domain-containing protein [Spirochaetales bacterium]|nr:substrate-binding domain-containing protein [Spirochaetales bacterium]MCF7939214.1 substrate-binding domain-containing protein [Spirochaetales bacterium]